MNKNLSLIYYKDDEANPNVEELKKSVGNVLSTNSMAVYRMSPVIVMQGEKTMTYPILSADKDSLSKDNRKTLNIKEDVKTIKEKYALTEDQKMEQVMSTGNYLSNLGDELDLGLDIKKPDEENDNRKYMDRYNLIRGFLYSVDPYMNRSQLLGEDDDYSDSAVKFEDLTEKLENLFDIKLN